VNLFGEEKKKVVLFPPFLSFEKKEKVGGGILTGQRL